MLSRPLVLKAGPLLLCLLISKQSKPQSSALPHFASKVDQTIDVIVRVDAYDWEDDWSLDALGRQFDTLVVRVEGASRGNVPDPWIRVDYYGANRHKKEDRLPEGIFEPGHRWAMRLLPVRISEKNYISCRPRSDETVKFTDALSGEVVSEVGRIRGVSKDPDDLPDINQLKCYALKRGDVYEVRDPE